MGVGDDGGGGGGGGGEGGGVFERGQSLLLLLLLLLLHLYRWHPRIFFPFSCWWQVVEFFFAIIR